MASLVLPNPDNFLGVALVVHRIRDGPRFVFHYPARIPPLDPSGRSAASRNDGHDKEDEDDAFGRPSHEAGLEASSFYKVSAAELAQWNHDDHLITDSGSHIVPWELVAGFPTKDLAGLLTPSRVYHKKLFQVSLDSLYCVSCPIHVPQNGVWKKKTKKVSKSQHSEKDGGATAKKDDEDTPATDAPGPIDADKVDVKDMAKPPAKQGEETEDKKSSMTMFNLVFFLNPKKHQVKPLVEVMFTHIIKKVNKAYKYCQERSDFVWKESKRILALKDKAREDGKLIIMLAS